MCDRPDIQEVVEIEIRWQDVIDIFQEKYNQIYIKANNTRLYFADKFRIDGARLPWMPLAMLDGMLTTLDPGLSQASATRVFDQEKILQNAVREVIMKEIEGKATSGRLVKLKIICPWESYEVLKASILSARVSRKEIVRRKFSDLADYVFNNLMEKGELSWVIEAITKLIYASIR